MAVAANPMEYYILPLTKEEHKQGGVAHGYKFVKEHEDRWVLVNDSNYELQTYDRGYTQVVYEDKVYVLVKDYIIIDQNKRVFILGTVDAEVDRLENKTSEEETNNTSEGTEEEKSDVTEENNEEVVSE